MTRFRWGVATDVGRVRSVNQDNAAAIEGFFAVADGMGGHRGGEVASSIAVESLTSSLPLLSSDELLAAIQESNSAVLRRATDDPGLRGMGTTLCVLALVDDGDAEPLLLLANVGDSRIYKLSSGHFEQMTDDHSMVAEMMREGRITAAEAASHPQRNVLTRALGIDAGLHVDAWHVWPIVGDRWLLCSDGLFNEVSDATIAAVLGTTSDPAAAAQELVRLANEGGGRDNVTVLVVDVIEDSDHAVIAPTVANPVVGADVEADTLLVAAGSRVRADTDRDAAPGRRSTVDRVRATWRVLAFAAALVVLGAVAIVAWIIYDGGGSATNDPPAITTTSILSTVATSTTLAAATSSTVVATSTTSSPTASVSTTSGSTGPP